MAEIAAIPAYPRLFSEWQIRSTTIANRVVFAPTCPTWVADPYEGIFTDQAVAYYEERARGGCGLIIIGGTIIHPEALYSEFNFPGLWKDDQVDGLARVAEAVHRHGCKLACQLLHAGPARHARAEEGSRLRLRRRVVHGRAQPGAARRVPERADAEGARGARDRGDPRRLRRRRAPCRSRPAWTASSTTCRTATCPGSSSRRSTTTAATAGAAPTRTACASRSSRCSACATRSATTRSSATASTRPRSGRAISSSRTSSAIVADLESAVDLDYVNLSAGVHHSFIHTPMTYEPGWERGYTKAVKEVSTKPVLLVGRITHPGVAEDILAADEADAILLARQMFADADWAVKAREGRADDIRRCVAANYCWRSVIRGGRVQCVYNAEVGRERAWGHGTLKETGDAKKVVVIGGGPVGPRVRAHRGRPRPRRRGARARGRDGRPRAHALAAARAQGVRADRPLAPAAGDRQRRRGAHGRVGRRGRPRGAPGGRATRPRRRGHGLALSRATAGRARPPRR